MALFHKIIRERFDIGERASATTLLSPDQVELPFQGSTMMSTMTIISDAWKARRSDILPEMRCISNSVVRRTCGGVSRDWRPASARLERKLPATMLVDRKSTRLNSSHLGI